MVAEGWYPTANVSLCPAQGVTGRARPTFLRRGGREEEGGGSSDAFSLLLSPLACSKRREGKQTPLMQEDVGGLREEGIRQLEKG